MSIAKHLLMVTGSDYTPQVYQGFERLRQDGVRLSLLSDGSFTPRPHIFDKHHALNLRDTSEVMRSVETWEDRPDAVANRSSEWLTPLVSLITERFGLIGNSPHTAFLCRSKYHMRQHMADYKLPSVPFVLCRSHEEICAAVAQLGTRCVAKPIGGNASYGTFVVDSTTTALEVQQMYQRSVDYLRFKAIDGDVFAFSSEELRSLGCESYVDMVTDYIVEGFIEGPEISIDSLVVNGKATIMGIAKQTRMAPPYFVQLAECMPFCCETDLRHELELLNQATVSAFGITNSPVHLEIILSPQGPVLVEIACRIGGDNIHDAVLQTTGYHLMYEAACIALGRPNALTPETVAHTAMAYILPERSGVVKSCTVPQAAREHPALSEISIEVSPGQKVVPPPIAFDFLGYVQAKGVTPEQAAMHLRDLLDMVTISYE